MFGDLFGNSDLLQILRAQQLMQQQPSVSAPQTTQSTFYDDEQPQDGSAAPNIASVPSTYGSFTPSTTARDRLNSMLDQMPQYQPLPLRNKIIGGIIGAAYGPDEAMKFVNQPYDRAMGRWEAGLRGAQTAASDENTANNTSRSIAAAAGLQAHRDTQDELARTKENDLDAVRKQNADTRALMAQIDQYKAQNPNLVFKEINGQLVASDPKTGAGQPVINPNTGQPFAGLTDLQKLMYQKENQLAEIEARGNQARQTKSTPAGGETDTTTDLPPAQQLQAKTQLMNTLISQHPEYAPYFQKDDAGNYLGTALFKPNFGGYFGSKGGNQQTLDAINQAMGAAPTTKTTKTVRTPATQPLTKPVFKDALKPGYVRVMSKDGKQWGQAPANAIPPGFIIYKEQ